MEEPVGAQYAVQIAVATLKERCKNLQKRVDELEEENLSLKVQSNKNQQQLDSKSLASDTEICHLRELLTKCMEKYQQMSNKMKMVQLENRDLWHRLSNHQPTMSARQQIDSSTNTAQANSTDTKLVKNNSNNDSYSVHRQMSPQKDQEKHQSSPLIRSRTFTQEDTSHDVTKILHRNVAEQTRICSQLEQISLEIRESFAKGKNELDSLLDDILDERHYDESVDRNNEVFISDSLGFYHEDVDDDSLTTNFRAVVEELLNTKEVVHAQKQMLQVALTKLADFQDILKQVDGRSLDSKNKKLMLDKTTFVSPNELLPASKSTSIESAAKTCDKNTSTAVAVETRPQTTFLRQESTLSAANNKNNNNNNNSGNHSNNIRREESPGPGRMCPVCSAMFYTGLEQLQSHVETHFTDDINTFELL